MQIPQPDIRPIADGKYRLAETYRLAHGGVKFIIRERFIHDGASVPRLVWTLTGLRPDGLLRAAALIHDALYVHAGNLPPFWVQPHRTFTRVECDRIFYEIMREAGVSAFKRKAAYAGVRLGGWLAWRKHQQRIRSESL